jgi:hypothetical protein
MQEKVYLSDSRILYKPDFTIFDIKQNKTYWSDYKGMRTSLFQLKLRLWMQYGPGELKIMEGTEFAIRETDSIVALRGHHVGKKIIRPIRKSKKS